MVGLYFQFLFIETYIILIKPSTIYIIELCLSNINEFKRFKFVYLNINVNSYRVVDVSNVNGFILAFYTNKKIKVLRHARRYMCHVLKPMLKLGMFNNLSMEDSCSQYRALNLFPTSFINKITRHK